MAQPFVTGPGHIFVGLPSGVVYFGTAEDGVTVEIIPAYVPVMNDISGPKVPFDQCYVGEQARLSATMTRWNEPVYAAMASRSAPSLAVARGTDLPTARGTLMITEGAAYPLWVQYPFGAGGALALAAMATLPGGYHFFAAWLAGPDKLEPGVKPYKERFTWDALGIYNPVSGSFPLYDSNMAGLPGTN